MVVIREDVVAGEGAPVRQAIELGIGVMVRLMRQFLGPQWRPRRICFCARGPEGPGHAPARRSALACEFSTTSTASCARRATSTPPTRPATRDGPLRPAAAGHGARSADPVDVGGGAAHRAAAAAGRALQHGAGGHAPRARRAAPCSAELAEEGHELLGHGQRDCTWTSHAPRQEQRPCRCTEVAALLGFSAPSGFSRWYQSQFDCSPSQTRQAKARVALTGPVRARGWWRPRSGATPAPGGHRPPRPARSSASAR